MATRKSGGEKTFTLATVLLSIFGTIIIVGFTSWVINKNKPDEDRVQELITNAASEVKGEIKVNLTEQASVNKKVDDLDLKLDKIIQGQEEQRTASKDLQEDIEDLQKEVAGLKNDKSN